MDSNLTVAEVTNVEWLSKGKDLGSMEKIMDSVQVFLYSVVFVLGILGNGLVIWITGFKMQKTVNSIWFLNLAVADFLFSAMRCLRLVKNAFFSYWPFGEFICRANSFLKYLNMFCSIFLLAFISLDRCTSVVLPVWSRNNRQPRLAWVVSVISWMGAVVASLPFYIFSGLTMDHRNRTKCSEFISIGVPKSKASKQSGYIHRFISGFLIPSLVILTCYLLIGAKLKQRSLTKSKKPFRVILVIIITFFICWTPYHVFLLLKLMGMKGLAMTIGSPLTSSLAYLNSCINPFLYFFMGLDFKRKLNQSLLDVFKRSLWDDETMSGFRRRWKWKTCCIDKLEESTVTRI